MLFCLEIEKLIVFESVCQLLELFEAITLVLFKDQTNLISDATKVNVINDHVLIVNVLDPHYKFEYLRVTLIEVDKYNNNIVEQFINDTNFKKNHYETNTVRYKLELYEREPPEEFENNNKDIESNGILYWKSLSKRFPIFSKIVHNYLAIQPSSVVIEKAFL
ncbi:21337_t:CDS:2 [Cetraspora pellucida]|uniref:21337_t:CDS:1 n=1 Tax=Cetraspora pellucida TaxID=1433469 RepID=A0A9N9NFD1_9GLOM|nr:21337_t:CDS:2 [Cetraspora pellucida]